MYSFYFICSLVSHTDDYTSTTVDLIFNSNTNEVCTNITLLEDLVVEDAEQFRVILSSADPAVTLIRDVARVAIVDRTSECRVTGIL